MTARSAQSRTRWLLALGGGVFTLTALVWLLLSGSDQGSREGPAASAAVTAEGAARAIADRTLRSGETLEGATRFASGADLEVQGEIDPSGPNRDVGEGDPGRERRLEELGLELDRLHAAQGVGEEVGNRGLEGGQVVQE